MSVVCPVVAAAGGPLGCHASFHVRRVEKRRRSAPGVPAEGPTVPQAQVHAATESEEQEEEEAAKQRSE